MNDTNYTPVAYEYREVIEEQIAVGTTGKIFYWDEQRVEEAIGKIENLTEITGKGMFIILDSKRMIRIDKIITLFGKPGAGFDEYDAFANQCLSCTAGVPL
jgi:hypothetical protein